jgi:integrase
MPLKLVPPRKGWSPYFRVRGTYLGVYVNRSTKTCKRAVANKLLAKWQGDIERGEFAEADEATFASAALAYMKAGGDRRPMTPLLNYFGETKLSKIDQPAIDTAALVLFPGEDVSPATRNREVYTPVSAVLKFAGVDFKIRRPKGSRGRVITRWLWPEQAFRIFDAAHSIDPEFAILLEQLCYTGPRLSEELRLLCDDVRLSESFAYLRTTKNGEPRAVHLPAYAVASLANHPRGLDRKGQRVFKFNKGGSLYWLLEAACMVASGLPQPKRVKVGKKPKRPPYELEWVNFHTFCHTWATWMRRYGGLDEIGLVATGRWKDRQSAARYAHAVVSEESRRAEFLPTPGARPVQMAPSRS